MIFFGSLLSLDEMAPAACPTDIQNINHLTIGGVFYDDVFITKDMSVLETIPMKWDWYTIFHAKYDRSLSAGNVDFSFKDIYGSYILIKRRIADTYHWITIKAYPVVNEDLEDLNTLFVDYTAAPGTEYEYAIVPIIDGVEGEKYAESITPETERLVVADKDAVWATIVTNGFCDSQRNTAPGVVDTMNNKYPTIIHNGLANYDTVTVTAGWFPTEEDDCTLQVGPEYDRWVSKYAKKFMDYLTNRNIKMLKNVDGRMWLCYVTTLPSNTARDVYWDREITFGITEIGDVESEKVLYDAGLIDAEERWWSSE